MAEENTPIKLNDLLHIRDEDLKDWTICLNIKADFSENGLYCFTGIPKEDQRVMEHISWRKGVNDKNAFRNIDTKYCLQFIGREGYSDEWLFLGAYEIDPNKRTFFDKNGNERYNLIPMDCYSCFNERLVIKYKKKQGPKQAKLPSSLVNSIDIEVVEILDDVLGNKNGSFNGYHNVCLPFITLENIVNKESAVWKQALENMFGVYVITDLKEHKHYIGSAYGDQGFWSRWCNYVETGGHGGDVTLKEVVKREPDYAEKHFQFAIIEVTTNSDQKYVVGRETYWKKVFDTINGGYNNN